MCLSFRCALAAEQAIPVSKLSQWQELIAADIGANFTAEGAALQDSLSQELLMSVTIDHVSDDEQRFDECWLCCEASF